LSGLGIPDSPVGFKRVERQRASSLLPPYSLDNNIFSQNTKVLLRLVFRFYNHFLSEDKELARRLRQLIGFTPANMAIFKLAFSHKSSSSEKPYAVQNNERLEYLGDAVLGTIVAEYLFKKYPNSDEGFLTKMRSKIVKRKSLNLIGDKMGLDMLLSEYNQTRLSRSMLGNAVEALVGAVYLEKGYKGTKRFVVNKILRNYVDVHELETVDDNYKSQLLEWCQKNGQTVTYKLLARYKFEKRDRFKVAVMVNGKKIATADDFNKKSAEQTASEKAMHSMGILDTED
jgi:ribonuclease-3